MHPPPAKASQISVDESRFPLDVWSPPMRIAGGCVLAGNLVALGFGWISFATKGGSLAWILLPTIVLIAVAFAIIFFVREARSNVAIVDRAGIVVQKAHGRETFGWEAIQRVRLATWAERRGSRRLAARLTGVPLTYRFVELTLRRPYHLGIIHAEHGPDAPGIRLGTTSAIYVRDPDACLRAITVHNPDLTTS